MCMSGLDRPDCAVSAFAFGKDPSQTYCCDANAASTVKALGTVFGGSHLLMTVWMGSASTSHDASKSAANRSWFNCNLLMPAHHHALVLYSGTV